MKKTNFQNKPLADSKINLLAEKDNLFPRGKKIFKLSRFIVYLLVVLVLAFVVFSYQVLFTGDSITEVFSGKINIFQQLSTLAGDGSRLQGETDNRINVLLLGMGGAGHDGPYLTDTIMLASIQPSTKKVSMISIPRDLQVEIPGYGWWKINNANAFGENKNPDNGALLTKEVVQNVFDLPIHYYVRIDFSGFEKIIDSVDGVKVSVDRGFTDYQYPTNDHKYQIVSFEEGWQTMDGETALKYARSRHGNNGEGSDFARSQRQQKILQAFKDRILSRNFLLSPRKISKMTKEFASHLRTDMEPWEIVKLAQLLKDINTDDLITEVLDDSAGGFLYPNIVNEAYVLQPRGGDFSQIQFMAKNIFLSPEELPEPLVINVEIKNGTNIAGLASRASQELKLGGFRVMQIGNAPLQNYTQTEVYQISNRDLSEQKQQLEGKYQVQVIENTVPAWITDMAAPDLDFFIILGEDAESL